MKDRKNEKIIISSNLTSSDINEKNLIKKIKNNIYGFLSYNSKTFFIKVYTQFSIEKCFRIIA